MSPAATIHPGAPSEVPPIVAPEPVERPVPDEPTPTSADFRRRFTIPELEKLYELGFFDDEKDRYELVDGDLIEMGRVQPPHASAVNRSTRLFTLGLRDRASVIIQNPMRVDERVVTQFQPDVTLAKFRRDGYAKRHPFPEDMFLAIEMMESTHSYDRNVKLPKYAKAGIPETWLVDLPGQEIEAHRRPVDGVYSDRTILRPGDSIAPAAFPDLVLSVSEILGAWEDEGER